MNPSSPWKVQHQVDSSICCSESVGAFLIAEDVAVAEAALGGLVLEQVVVQGALRHGPVAGLAGDAAEGEIEAQPVNDGATLVAGELHMAFLQNASGRVDVAALDQFLPSFLDPRQVAASLVAS